MTVTLAYDATLSRVRITADDLGTATTARIERSTDLVRWTTVRGGAAAAVTGGGLSLPVDDYEFAPNVVNSYRVRGLAASSVTTNVAVGASATGNNTAVTPGLPAGIARGDLMLLLASIRNSGTGTVNTPAGWTPLVTSGNVALFGRRYVPGDAAPAVTFAGGVAGEDTIAQVYGRRNAELVPVGSAAQLNASAQDIAYPALPIGTANCAVIIAGWKQDDWTGVAQLVGGTEIGEPVSIAGSDAGMVWDRIVQTTAANITAGVFTVTGGAAAISRGLVAAFRPADYQSEQSATISPALTAVWLKSVVRPFLNQPIALGGSDFTAQRPARGSVHDVVGRSLPVAVTDVRGSRRYTLTLRTLDATAAATLDYILASGDVLYLHAPAGKVVPAGGVYVRVEDTQEHRLSLAGELRHWTVPVVEVAAPGPDVIGSTATCQTVLNLYATCAAVVAAFATCADLLAQIAPPSEVIVA